MAEPESLTEVYYRLADEAASEWVQRVADHFKVPLDEENIRALRGFYDEAHDLEA